MHKYGTVLELKKNSAIIMSEGFRYFYVKKRPGMYLGQKIMFLDEDIVKPTSAILKYSAVAACFVLIVLAVFLSRITLFDNDGTFAYVYLDINPSVQITIDKNNTVLDTSAVNSDADELLEGLDTKGMDLKDALKIIFEKSDKLGFFKDDTDNYVLISGVINPDSRLYKENKTYEETEFQKFLSTLKGVSGEKGHKRIITEAIKTSPEIRELALKNQMSPGKYYLYELAAEKGMDLSIDKVRESSINDIMKVLDYVPQDVKESKDSSFNDVHENDSEASDDPPAAAIQKQEEDVTFSEEDTGAHRGSQTVQGRQMEESEPDAQPEIATQTKEERQPAHETKPDGGAGPEAQQPAENTNTLKAPGAAVISVDKASNTGEYQLTIVIGNDNNAAEFKLYENNRVIMSSETGSRETVVKSFSGKENGSYTYICELSNSAGKSMSNEVNVLVQKTVNKEAAVWDAGVMYSVGDVAEYGGEKYKCIQAHKSQADWTPERVPALWQKQLGSAEKNSWQPGNAYRTGDIVVYKETQYRCLQAHTAIEGWEPPVVPALWEKQQ